MTEEMRRIERVSVCCRASVRDRYGVWTAVTEDASTRGCRISSSRLLRAGTVIHVTLSSDLFHEELEAVSQVVWATPDRLGVAFLDPIVRRGLLPPQDWIAKVVEHGATPGSLTPTIVPVVRRVAARDAREVKVLRPIPAARAQTQETDLRLVSLPARHA